ncbi:MAG: hypothetical protein ACE5HV_00115 [Acidobacteriota bacterium]
MYYAVIHDTKDGGRAMAVFPDREEWKKAKSRPEGATHQPNEEFVQFKWIDFMAKNDY